MSRPAEFDRAVVALLVNLRANAMSLTRDRDRAEDLVQETILKALRFHASYQEGTNLGAWLFTIMRNEHYTRFRREALYVEDADGVHALMMETPAAQEPHLALVDAIRSLERANPAYGEAAVMMAEGYTLEEIASVQGVPTGTVKSRVSRGREYLAGMVA